MNDDLVFFFGFIVRLRIVFENGLEINRRFNPTVFLWQGRYGFRWWKLSCILGRKDRLWGGDLNGRCGD